MTWGRDDIVEMRCGWRQEFDLHDVVRVEQRRASSCAFCSVPVHGERPGRQRRGS